MIMTTSKDDLARVRTLFALDRVPQSLHSDLLSDGTIAAQFKIKTSRPVELDQGRSISQDLLFDVFRQTIATGAPAPIPDGDETPAVASFADDGAGLVVAGEKRLRFDYVGLLSEDLNERQRWLTEYLARNSLTDAITQELRSTAAGPSLSNDEFLNCVMRLQKSPQALEVRLAQRLDEQRLSPNDILPEDLGYWNNLTAPLKNSKSLAEF